MSDNNNDSQSTLGEKAVFASGGFLFGFVIAALSVTTAGLAIPVLAGIAGATAITKLNSSGSGKPKGPEPK